MTTWLANNPWTNLPEPGANYRRIGGHPSHNNRKSTSPLSSDGPELMRDTHC